jgi:hypothetical protein
MTDTDNAAAKSLVKGPAIAILISNGIGILLALLTLVLNLAGIGMGAASGSDQGIGIAAEGAIGVVQSILGLAIGSAIIVGILKMMELQSYGFAMTATILAMIPCLSPCCFLGLPFGIWGIVMLCKPEVKEAFARVQAEMT